MENMCNKSDLINKNEISEDVENEKSVSRSESPVFKCFNAKPTRINRVDSSSDYDIPSYQVNQSAKSKASSKHESESNDSFLPFTPSISPVLPTVQFQPPSIHSLGTVFKSMKQISNGLSEKQSLSKKSSNVFEDLGMTDKDISWVSSMASPPPPQVPGSEFNTIEKATFFPEEKFQNIQPRALFSPTHDEDFGCKPLSFSSESEDEETYKTNIRLSDVCATLNQLEMKSFEQAHPETSSNSCSKKNNEPTSPVIKMNLKKSENSAKKKKPILVKSPPPVKNYNFTMEESVSTPDRTSSSGSVQNFIEDDSFQSMSFSCLDELCKTLVNSTTSSKSIDCDKTIVNHDENVETSKFSVKKCFYATKTKTNVQEVTTNVKLYAGVEALEEGNVTAPQVTKIEKSFTEKGIVRLDELNKSGKVDAVKRLHSDQGLQEDNQFKKLKTEESGVCNWDEEKDLCLSQHSVSDTEMFETVENLEKTLRNQEFDKSKIVIVGNEIVGCSSINTTDGNKMKVSLDSLEKAKKLMLDCSEDDSDKTRSVIKKSQETEGIKTDDILWSSTPIRGSCSVLEEKPGFSGSKLEICEGDGSSNYNLNLVNRNFPFGFSTASGTKINVSKEAVEKAKTLMSEEMGKDFSKEKPLVSEKKEPPLFGFSTAGGTKVNISKEALEKAKAFMSEERSTKEEISLLGFSTAGGTKVNISKEALEKAKVFMSEECSTKEELPLLGFSTAAGTKVNISKEALEKAKTFMSEEWTEDCVKKVESIVPSLGFSTAAGTKVNISKEALEKAKTFMSEELTEDCVKKVESIVPSLGFSTAAGTKVNVTKEALEKAKALMSEETKFFGEEKETIGFSNAAGTKVNISKEASKKAMDKEEIRFTEMNSEKESFTGFTNSLPEVLDFGFSTAAGTKVSVTKEALEKAKALMSKEDVNITEERNSTDTMPLGFSTAAGTRVNVSKEALEKARELMAKEELKCNSDIRGSDSDKKSLRHAQSNTSAENNSSSVQILKEKNSNHPGSSGFSFKGFSTASGNIVKVSTEALEKAKALMAEDETLNKSSTLNTDIPTTSTKDSVKSDVTKENLALQVDPTNEVKSGAEVNQIFSKSTNFEDDWDEIIPSWLHVYTTSPSIASDRTDVIPMVCDEDDKSSALDREYLVKSPVLGSHDRFAKKKRRKKLDFGCEKSSDSKLSPTCLDDVPNNSGTKSAGVKRTSNCLSLDFSAPFKKIKSEADESRNVKEERAKARFEQEKVVNEKQKVKPSKGSQLVRKNTEKQMKWMEAVKGAHPDVYSDEYLRSMNVQEGVLGINVTNAGDFKFNGVEFFGYTCLNNTSGFRVGDGCMLIPDDDNKFGLEEFKSAFLASSGVQPNLIPLGWLENHYKWIVWKLSHYEKSFPQFFGGGCFTPHNVMLQLKYRYDREIDGSERSALKKILERDDTSIKRLVLCVCGIKKMVKDKLTEYKLDLTDGWYSCPARGDPAMTKLVEEGKITIGTKLVTQGATLVNCEQGISPLEVTEDVYLKISTNSTRRVRWDTKLGYQKNPENFTVSLGSVLPQGGNISCLNIIIVRVYPMLYMEKTADGCHVTRNLRSEEKAEAEHQRIQEKRMEAILNEITLEMEKSEKNQKKKFENSEGFSQIMENNSDPSGDLLTLSQRQSYQNIVSNRNDRRTREIREKIEQKLKKEKLGKRNVSEFFRVRIVDLRKPDYNNPAILTIWNPNEEVVRVLVEGKAVGVSNISIGNSSRSYKPVQLNTTRSSQFREINKSVKYPSRKLTHLKDVSSKVCPAFEEVDLVGVVTKMQEIAYGSRLSQVVYLTDLDFNFVGILFWGSCKNYGWENVFKLYSTVACSNLLWKKNYSVQEVPVLHVNESSVFTENPKHSYLKEELEKLKSQIPQDKNSYFAKFEEELMQKLEESKWKNNTSRSFSASDSPLCRSRLQDGFESKPTASSTPIKPCSSLLDSNEAEPSPIQKRIEKLQSYGEPPPLLPLIVSNRGRRLKKK